MWLAHFDEQQKEVYGIVWVGIFSYCNYQAWELFINFNIAQLKKYSHHI